ncbi:hypothetical protein KSF78_0009037 [Schistosoma japonicum]|nr:hypothetical protein KSF78_0009037 [Schistosoma japonicum]
MNNVSSLMAVVSNRMMHITNKLDGVKLCTFRVSYSFLFSLPLVNIKQRVNYILDSKVLQVGVVKSECSVILTRTAVLVLILKEIIFVKAKTLVRKLAIILLVVLLIMLNEEPSAKYDICKPSSRQSHLRNLLCYPFVA